MSRVTKTVPAKRIQEWNAILARRSAHVGVKHGEVIEEFDIKLFDDEELEVQFKLVNGDKECCPYLDVILWDDGVEVSVCHPGHEKLDDEFKFRDSYMGREYTLIITPE